MDLRPSAREKRAPETAAADAETRKVLRSRLSTHRIRNFRRDVPGSHFAAARESKTNEITKRKSAAFHAEPCVGYPQAIDL